MLGNIDEVISYSDQYLAKLNACEKASTAKEWMEVMIDANNIETLIKYGNALGGFIKNLDTEKFAALEQIQSSPSGAKALREQGLAGVNLDTGVDIACTKRSRD